MFKEERESPAFQWSMIGNVAEGRPNLGLQTDVRVYRLMQFTLRDVMITQFGVAKTNEVLFLAGKMAGTEYFRNVVPAGLDFSAYINALQEGLKGLGIGILRVEKADLPSLQFTLTVEEDLDCSGLPFCDEEICAYDEGFLAGLLGAYTGQDIVVREIDCWCSGARVCRFDCRSSGAAFA
jgi:predicted hydrocarbon binding protein